MIKRQTVTYILLLASIIALSLIGCTTSKGSLYSKIVIKESGTKQTKEESNNKSEKTKAPPEDEETEGLKIITHPDNADIYLNNKYIGKSPIKITDLDRGTYSLTIEKEDYYTKKIWIEYDGNLQTYETDLKQITGFLIIETQPDNAIIETSNSTLHNGLNELPVGKYTIIIKSFGYKDYKSKIEITPQGVLQLKVKLKKAEFNVTDLSGDKKIFNPRNPGLIGTVEFSFKVTSWGDGKFTIYNNGNRVVFSKKLEDFTTWSQYLRWNGKSNSGSILPDGLYRVELIAVSRDKKITVKRETSIKIDSSIIVAYRTMWTGGSGLLYTETPGVLPPFDFQLSMITVGHIENIAGENYPRFPTLLALRLGINNDMELGISGAIILENTDSNPYNINLSLKKRLIDIGGTIKFKLATDLKLKYQNNTTTDIFTNPGGISISLPLNIATGALNLLYTPEIALSYYRVLYPYMDIATDSKLPKAWLYNRIGLLLDLGFLTTGISFALRSSPINYPMPNNWLFIESPYQLGTELNFILPDTRIFTTIAGIAEIRDYTNYYISFGLGLSYLY